MTLLLAYVLEFPCDRPQCPSGAQDHKQGDAMRCVDYQNQPGEWRSACQVLALFRTLLCLLQLLVWVRRSWFFVNDATQRLLHVSEIGVLVAMGCAISCFLREGWLVWLSGCILFLAVLSLYWMEKQSRMDLSFAMALYAVFFVLAVFHDKLLLRIIKYLERQGLHDRRQPLEQQQQQRHRWGRWPIWPVFWFRRMQRRRVFWTFDQRRDSVVTWCPRNHDLPWKVARPHSVLSVSPLSWQRQKRLQSSQQKQGAEQEDEEKDKRQKKVPSRGVDPEAATSLFLKQQRRNAMSRACQQSVGT